MNPGGVLVIGLDGGTLDLIGPLARRGVMPTFRRLIEGGRAGALRSTVPWYTIPGWTSLMTGVQPLTHGLLHWATGSPSGYLENLRAGRRFLTSADIARPTFWDVAGVAARRVAVVNMPLTYPAWPVNGSMVTGLLTPKAAAAGACYPPDLLERFPDYRVDLSVSREAESPDAPAVAGVDLQPYLRELLEVTERRRELAAAVLEGDVDLGVVVFVGPDRISHKAWDEQAAVASRAAETEVERLIEDYYRRLDAAVGDLVGRAGGEATVMVVADHGFGPPPERSFSVNAWLRYRGHLRLRGERVQRLLSSSRLGRRASRAVTAWRRGGPRGQPVPPAVDWRRTAVYAVTYPYTRLFGLIVNRAGAKEHGWVDERGARELLDRLRAELAELRDERGRRVVRGFHEAEGGGAFFGRPDLIVEVEDPFFPQGGFRRNRPFQRNPNPSGLHLRDGIFVLAGPRVRGTGEASADIVDVAPTALALLGLEPPAEMEGRVLDDLVEVPHREPVLGDVPRPGGPAAFITEDEEREIEAHLEALGYTD
ncbi:MAG TPA: alkaline phosphatase family protein [Actinomycetota bacterium]|nr:alkaline phosphatase family protein [Actinomycetota bacterium]